MNKKKAKVSVERGVISRLLAKAGYKKLSDVKMNALAVTAADGTELTIDREEGEPQVGDTASPDGEFVMEDGSTIVIADGVITDIIPSEENDVTAEGLDEDELMEKVEELQTENETLSEEIDTLTEEKEELEAQLEALKGARVLSSNEKVILAKVNRAGGLDWLNKVCASSSSATPAKRSFRDRNGGKTNETPTQRALREKKEALANKRKK